jgi:ribulose-phosphate 3-epimerase
MPAPFLSPVLQHRSPRRLAVDVSLWSADLGALRAEIQRLTPYADLFHFDVSDTQFTPEPLFFPDLVAALRAHTPVPFHIHLMAHRPAALAGAFARAGADLVSVHAEADDVAEALDVLQEHETAIGLALRLDTPVGAVLPHLDVLDAVVMIGTPLGTKGSTMAVVAPARVRELRLLLAGADRAQVPVFADGGIRQDTVPVLAQAGADAVVAGSLLLNSHDPAATTGWLHSHRPATSHRACP